jgi:outer membrane protein OmpA-like peptidoglycan-associated protein
LKSFDRPRTLGLVALALGLVGLSPRTASAQNANFYLDRLVVAGGPDDGVGVWRPQVSNKLRFYGQFGLGFALNPFRTENMLENQAARSQLALKGVGNPDTAQLNAYMDVGVEFLKRFGVQVQLPITVFQHGNATNDPQVVGATNTTSIATVAPMDMRLDGRAQVFQSDDGRFKLGLDAAVWIPTGNRFSFGGDGAAHGGLFGAAEIDLKSAFFTLNTGIHLKPPNGLNDFRTGTEWTWALGAFLPMRGDSFRLGAEVFGSAAVGGEKPFKKANIPIEWLAEGRLWIDEKKQGYVSLAGGTRLDAGYAPDFRVVALIGGWFGVADTAPPSPAKKYKIEYAEHGADTDHDGIPDDVDLCPTVPEDHKPPNTDDGCPAPPDRDGDGIPDDVDKCPDNPEDFDGIQDQDGCPEDDADKDGIPDATDHCPKEPGEKSEDPNKNGCPQFIRRVKGSSEIEILKRIEFATGKATILPKSFPILDEVVRLMKVNLDIKHLAIEGHTDNRGSDALNEKLSKDRAESCLKYLVDHGVDANRLTAEGFGPKKPIADNKTEDGRQRNRRTEFHIRDSGVTGVQEQGGPPPDAPQPSAPPSPPPDAPKP